MQFKVYKAMFWDQKPFGAICSKIYWTYISCISSTTWKSAALGGTCLFQLHWNSVRFFLLQAWLFGHYHEWMARNWFKSLCTCSLLDLVYYNEKQTIKKMLSKIHKPFLKVNTPYWFVKFVIALKFRVSRCSQGSLRRRETLEIFIPKIKK